MNTPILSGTSIIGTNVRNAQAQELGNIKDIMIDTQSGEIAYCVLSFGGILGIGDKLFAVPFSRFTVETSTESFILNVTREQLENAPGFDKDNWPDFATESFRNEINTYYNVESPVYA